MTVADFYADTRHQLEFHHAEDTELPICRLCRRPISGSAWLVEICPMSETAAKEPDYWLAKEVAAVLRLSEKSIYRIMKDDPTFPHVRVGAGSVRFPRARVLRWLANRTQGK